MSEKSKRLIYDNCEIYGPDGCTMIGLCGKDRLKWYVDKGIAEYMSEKSIRLKFEPKYKNAPDKINPVRIKRENKCYACGITEDLVRFHVIAMEFKKSFPATWKSHNSIDVLSLCADCSSDASQCMQDLKNMLYREYNVSGSNYIDPHKSELKKICRKIVNNRRNGLDVSVLLAKAAEMGICADEDIVRGADTDVSVEYQGTKTPAEYIIRQVEQKNDGFKEFVKRFKDHFVERMNPIDLPDDFYADR